MNPTKLLKHALLRFPSIFPNVGNALHHMLFVIGNGYEWRNGEIANYFREDDKIEFQKIISNELAEMEERITHSCSARQILRLEKDRHDYLFTVQNIDRLVHPDTMNMEHNRSLYSWCEDYALIFKIPNNVTNEWLKVIYMYVDQLSISLSMKLNDITKTEKDYIERLPALLKKIDDMMVERKLLIPANERFELAARLIAEIKDKNEQSTRS